MRLVLLVSLRVLNSWEKPVTLEDILQLLNLQVSPTVLQERNGKGVCFIFDGLDEFSPHEGENSIVYQILNKTYLPQSIVIVASRPAALVKLRQRADKVIEVIGFLKDQILEYVMNYPFSNTSKANQLKFYLSSHPNVLHMCYLPIHAAMAAFLFEVMGKVPRTETEIYTHFTHFTLIRSLSKCKERDELEDEDINELLNTEEKEVFNVICEHALEITMLNKQVLDQDKKLKQLLQSKYSKCVSLGLVTVDRTAGLYGFRKIYTFLHLTYQEYLAAHHISTLSDEDQHKLIYRLGDTNHMQVVWKFYCGLVNFEGHEYKIKALIGGRNKISLRDIQCVYESQQKVVCDCFMNETGAQIVLEDKYLTTTDFTALGYLLANSSVLISLSLTNCNMNTEVVSALLKEAEGKSLCLRSLSYESHDIDLESITKLLLQQHSLEYLKISYIDETSSRTTHDYHNFSDLVSISLANLKELSLRNIHVELDTLVNLLQFCKELTSLTLIGVFKENDNVECLLMVASKCEKLETMSCGVVPYTYDNDACSICITRRTSTDVSLPTIQYTSMLLVQGVRGNYLQTLQLEAGCIYSRDIRSSSKYWPLSPTVFALHLFPSMRCQNVISAIIECVSDFSALEKLILRNIEIEATLLAGILNSRCIMLQELDLSGGWTRSLQEVNIFLALRNCSKLQKLVSNDMYIQTNGACVLASCLQHWPKLQELHLKGCRINDEGAEAIADNIKYCPQLNEVDLGENNISSKTLQMIKSSLKPHSETTESQSHNTSCCTLL